MVDFHRKIAGKIYYIYIDKEEKAYDREANTK